ncbi:MAG: adenylate/guanylate cyclase domain-containing protein [Acidimicrobiales bacterium]
MRGPSMNRYIAVGVAQVGGANVSAGVIVFAYQNLLVDRGTDPRIAIGLFLTFLIVALPIAAWLTGRRLADSVRFLPEFRPATPAEAMGVLTIPIRLAALAFVFWCVGTLLFAGLAVRQGLTAVTIARDAFTTVLGGVTAGVVTLLVAERHVRPVVALALAGRPPLRNRAFGMTGRMLVSWGLGSGVPLLGLAAAELRTPAAPPLSSQATIFLALIGLGVGALLVTMAARSVAEPLRDLQIALSRVSDGNLDIAVPVDDAGEVGELQGGFNAMVAGLRERRRLEDLFGRHVGSEVAQQALRHGTGLGGEVRDASALFVDLVGSTNLANDRSAVEVVALLNAFFGAVVHAVGKEEGWVNKFDGDGALCIFGAPGDQPDHASRALRAARDLHGRLVKLSEEWPALDAGIGVSSGSVVAGNVGAEERYEYTLIGDPVNEAARLTEEAKLTPGRVLASSATALAAGDEAAHWVHVGDIALRGRSRPTAAHAPAST